jgi:hypothetical protein
MYLQKVVGRKILKKISFVGILKVNDENSRIVRGMDSHGSGTLIQ